MILQLVGSINLMGDVDVSGAFIDGEVIDEGSNLYFNYIDFYIGCVDIIFGY